MSSIFSSGNPSDSMGIMGGSDGSGFEMWFQTYQNKKIQELNKQIQEKQENTLADPDRTEAIDETEVALKRIKKEADSLDILQHKSKSVVSNLSSYTTSSQAYMALKATLHGLDPVTHKPKIMTQDDADKLNSYRSQMVNSLSRVKDLSLGRDFKKEFKDAYDTNNDAPDDERVTSFNTGPWNQGIMSGVKKLKALLVPKKFTAGSTMLDQVAAGNVAAGGKATDGDKFGTYAALHLDKHATFSLKQDRIFNNDVKHAVAHIAYQKNQKETTLKRLPRDRLSNDEMKKLKAVSDQLKSKLGVEMTRLSDTYDANDGMAASAYSVNQVESSDAFSDMLSSMIKSDEGYYKTLMDNSND